MRTADQLEKHLYEILKPSQPTVQQVKARKYWASNNLFLHHMRCEVLNKLKVPYKTLSGQRGSNPRIHVIQILG